MTNMTIGSILIGSCDTGRLGGWYRRMLDAAVNPDGFLELDQISILVDRRDDVSAEAVEPGRHIINFHVDDIHEASERMRAADATTVGEVELRAEEFYGSALGLFPANYPSSRAEGELAAWFNDSEGNLLSISQPIRTPPVRSPS